MNAENLAGRWRFRCPTCGDWILLRGAKNGGIHGFCETCGLQVFWRRKYGIDLLKEIASRGGDPAVLIPVEEE